MTSLLSATTISQLLHWSQPVFWVPCPSAICSLYGSPNDHSFIHQILTKCLLRVRRHFGIGAQREHNTEQSHISVVSLPTISHWFHPLRKKSKLLIWLTRLWITEPPTPASPGPCHQISWPSSTMPDTLASYMPLPWPGRGWCAGQGAHVSQAPASFLLKEVNHLLWKGLPRPPIYAAFSSSYLLFLHIA